VRCNGRHRKQPAHLRGAKELRALLGGLARNAEARVVFTLGEQAVAAALFAFLTARWLGPSARGSIVVFMTTSSFLTLVGSLGIATGARVLLNASPPLAMCEYLRRARTLSLIHLLTAASVGLFLLARAGCVPTLPVSVIFVLFAGTQLFNYLQREALHGIGRHITALRGEVLSFALQTVAVGMLASVGRLRLVTAFLVMLGGTLAQSVYLGRHMQSVEPGSPSDRYSLLRLVWYSLPAVVSTLGQAFILRGDRLILGMLAGAAPVGVYSVAATFTEILWLAPGGIAQVAFRRASIGGAHNVATRTRTAALTLTVVAGVFLAAGANPFVTRLLGAGYSDAAGLVYVLIVAAVPMASFQLDVAVLNGLGRLSDGGRITMLGTVVMIAGCLVTIPRYGPYGAAWSSVATYTVMAVLARLWLRRSRTVPVPAANG
jgi:O-antigen/teichoic acid export membrane protein